MTIKELRILPPMAIGRLGSASVPLAAYELVLSKNSPLDFRCIIPKPTYTVDAKTGEMKAEKPRDRITFRERGSTDNEQGKIYPVAPFLEVFCITEESGDQLVPLNLDLLKRAGRSLADISWDVEVGNVKIFRRTGKVNDKIAANLYNIKDHQAQPLNGVCNNFVTDMVLPLGTVQFICPSKEYPGIRFRFTPAGGKVYGSSMRRFNNGKEEDDPIINNENLVIYDTKKGKWHGHKEDGSGPTNTVPGAIFAGYDTSDGSRVSWGYLDDECDGRVTVHLKNKGKEDLMASAHISAGPPTFAPDTLPIRVVSDELEQILLGPEADDEVSLEEAEDIVRRAFETIRLMNTTMMNGNSYFGRWNAASTMIRQDSGDFSRQYQPIMAPALVDNLALRVLHERIFGALSAGTAPWFADALRKPNEIGDLSDGGRRKMPAMMRGADGRMLTFTWRQINTIIKTTVEGLQRLAPEVVPVNSTALKASDMKAQLHYRGDGNPMSVLPRTAISNCFPGLELDLRNLWRRAFKGIILLECNNYVVDTEDDALHHLKGRRLVAIDRKPTMVETKGPVIPGSDPQTLATSQNPNAVSFMEWSNSLAYVLQRQGKTVTCHFTMEAAPIEVLVSAADLDDKTKYHAVIMTINHFFEGNSAALSKDIVQPGDLTQALCAPWQNDYRECACYYWAASRPDYVNITTGPDGLSTGDVWMARERTGQYIPDDRKDPRLLNYDELFSNWEQELRFIIKGKDATASSPEDLGSQKTSS